MNYANILYFLSVAIGIIGLLVGATGRLSKAKQDSVINALTKDNIATKDYNKTLEAETARIKTENEGYKRQNIDLKSLAQGSPQLKTLTKAIENQTKIIAQFFNSKDKK